jgi:hypothetical protein
MKATMYRMGGEEERSGSQQSRGGSENHLLLVAYWIRRFLVLAVFAALCSGCAVAAMSTQKNFSVSEEVKLDGSTENVMGVVEEVGKSLGYRVNSRMKHGEFNSLGFQRDSSMLTTMATGYVRIAHITVLHNAKEQKLDLTMTVAGNLGAGDEADAQKALQAFKEKLQEKLGAQK